MVHILLKKAMKLNYKLTILSLYFLISSFCFAVNHGLEPFQQNYLDASKNASHHCKMGNIYYNEKNYKAALVEYETAYNLAGGENSSSSSYLYNIAKCLLKLGHQKAAQKAIKGAIEKDCMNITYYEALAESYISEGSQNKVLERCLKDYKNPYNRVLAGLIYIKLGEKKYAKILFDEFINLYPDLIITQDVKNILKTL